MAVIIKSNKSATANIGNSFGATSDKNDYSLVLDFAQGYYAKKDSEGKATEVNINDVTDFTRSTTAYALNSYGELKAYQPNQLRVANFAGHKGAILEAYRKNLFLNSFTPKTQTVSLPATNLRYAVSVVGEGSVTLSGGNFDIVQGSSTVTQDSFAIIKLTNTGAAASLECVVNGSLVAAQVELLEINYPAISTPIKTGNSAVARMGEFFKIKESVLAEVLNGSTEYTVVAHAKLSGVETKAMENSNYISVFCAHHASDRMINSTVNLKPARHKFHKDIGGSDKSMLNEIYTDITDKATLAVSVTGSNIATASNGYSKEQSSEFVDGFSPDFISMAGHSNLYTFCVLQKLIVYPYAMTPEQLARLSGSWI